MDVRFKHVEQYLRHQATLPVIPRRGDRVKLDGQKYRVSDITWVIDDGYEPPHVIVTLED